MHLTLDQVSAFAALPLRSLRHESPNHIMHVLNTAGDVLSPRTLHPVFYGCYDWHSAVHGYWLLAHCARAFPDLPQAGSIHTLFAQHFTAARAQGRTVTPETFSERGLFFRADHFSLARRGVPALLFRLALRLLRVRSEQH